jgi:hypothetical protein
MKRYFLFFLPVFFLLAAQWRQGATTIAITSPAPDEILRGPVTITGKADMPNLVSAQLDFSYATNPTNTWFTIQTFSQPIADSTLATWDTTTITDGDYVLRLRVNLADGTSQEVTVPIKIGNDFVPTSTLQPTVTPEPDTVLIPTPFLLAASPTPSEVPRATPTTLPTNPVSLGRNQIYFSLGRGALVILGLFALAGIIVRARRY